MWEKENLLLLVVVTFFVGEGKTGCDELGTLFYEDIGCKPVFENAAKCPVRYECNLTYKKEHCLLRGQQFKNGEEVSENITNPSCHVHCACDDGEKFFCGELDCVESFKQPNKNCYFKYELDQCCSIGEVCLKDEDNSLLKKCKVDGREYHIGEEFFPESACVKCICDENFKGKFDGPNCRKLMCNSQITFGKQIRENCAPFYKNQGASRARACCPDEFICHSETDNVITVNQKAPISDAKCQFGTKSLKLGEGVTKYFSFFGHWTKAQCECVLPPFLTCTG